MKTLWIFLMLLFSAQLVLAFQPSQCTVGAGFGCEDYRATTGSTEFTLRNNLGSDIQGITLTVSGIVPFRLGPPESSGLWEGPQCDEHSCSVTSNSLFVFGKDMGHFIIYPCEDDSGASIYDFEVNYTSNNASHMVQGKLNLVVEKVGEALDCSAQGLVFSKPPLFHNGKIIRIYGQWGRVVIFIFLVGLLFYLLWKLKHRVFRPSWKIALTAGYLTLTTGALYSMITTNFSSFQPARLEFIPLVLKTVLWFVVFSVFYGLGCYLWRFKIARIIFLVLPILVIITYILFFFGIIR